jgi:hypothetical protein
MQNGLLGNSMGCTTCISELPIPSHTSCALPGHSTTKWQQSAGEPGCALSNGRVCAMNRTLVYYVCRGPVYEQRVHSHFCGHGWGARQPQHMLHVGEGGFVRTHKRLNGFFGVEAKELCSRKQSCLTLSMLIQQPVKGRFSSWIATVLSQSSKDTIVGTVSLSVRSCTKCKQPDQ